MKNLRTAILCAGTMLLGILTSAQENKIPINEPDYNKPRLFDGLPSRIPVTLTDLHALVDAPVGRSTSFNLAAESAISFDGEIVSVASQPDNRVQSVVLRSTNFNGARFTLSRITGNDGSYSFAGRIISFQHGDLYELKNEAGNLVLVKKNYHELINE